eukprot:snap_masked-scaffold_64-processed-gene-0.69-mRNA-1 protein AED:1.00 eAED:1.00 QI:0/-1/0/0/-1/1/1/0/106
MRHPVHDAKPPASNWQVMDDLFVFKYQKRDIPSLIEVLKENEKIVLTRSLILVAVCHAHLVFNHRARKFEWNYMVKNYVIKAEDKELLNKTITRFRKQCMHCQKNL